MSVVEKIAKGAGAALQPRPADNELSAFCMRPDGRIEIEVPSGRKYIVANERERIAHGCQSTSVMTAERFLGFIQTKNPHKLEIRPGVRIIVGAGGTIREAGR